MKALGKVVSREFPFLPDNTPRDLEIRAGLHLLRRARRHIDRDCHSHQSQHDVNVTCCVIDILMGKLYTELEAIEEEADA